MNQDTAAKNTLNDIPSGLSKPAIRALSNAGLQSLADIANMSEAEFRKLHGIGPKAVDLIVAAFEANGIAFADR
ncbi:helix-hairpin-helix domain-containing protein [Paenibacillus sp. OV219]|uniref:helix-hairpin-helix domain-containing protein n=1 Tax=Paenibacillus sp. OV219 TaxID=1884377 RepID=UPI0008B15071|nr:helix-hairpin-helix domain-containing protein [Paenibacillus sp. OV219]SEM91236.1 Helix-hairpin-helix domain-containing protein [Paenibacillus sp. OV219]